MLRWLLAKWLGAGPVFGVHVLRVKTGDTLVVRYPGLLSREQWRSIAVGFEALVPNGVRVAVVDGGMDLIVVTGEVKATTREARG